MSMMVSPTMLTYLPIMADFIPFRLTFVRSNEQLQTVFIKKLRGDIWPKIAAPSSTCVWITASFPSRITPQNIDDLKTTNRLGCYLQVRVYLSRFQLLFQKYLPTLSQTLTISHSSFKIVSYFYPP